MFEIGKDYYYLYPLLPAYTTDKEEVLEVRNASLLKIKTQECYCSASEVLLNEYNYNKLIDLDIKGIKRSYRDLKYKYSFTDMNTIQYRTEYCYFGYTRQEEINNIRLTHRSRPYKIDVVKDCVPKSFVFLNLKDAVLNKYLCNVIYDAITDNFDHYYYIKTFFK